MSTTNPLAQLVGKQVRVRLAHRDTIVSGRLLAAADEMLLLEPEEGRQMIINWLHVATVEGSEAPPPPTRSQDGSLAWPAAP